MGTIALRCALVQVDVPAAQLLLPYLAWSGYAAALTYKIRGLNEGGGSKAE